MSQKVFTDLKDEIVKTDSTELDVIAGAIYSSLGRIASQQAAQVAQAAKFEAGISASPWYYKRSSGRFFIGSRRFWPF